MTTGVLIVQSQPSSPEQLADYEDWYDKKHIPEVLAIEGFVSARRLRLLDGETFVVIYEIDTDVETAKANLATMQASGAMSKPVGVCLDPPPTVQYFRDVTSGAG
jgi:hypothetical protein